MTKSKIYHDTEQAFWHFVNKTEACWIWTGSTTPKGYGRIKLRGKTFRAHRLSWMLHNGNIPNSMLVCHQCDNPLCVNPEHLFLGTPDDNMKDMVAKGRQAKADTHLSRTKPSALRRGENHGRAKLSEHDVRTIRSLSAQGLPALQIAKRYGVSSSTIDRILKRETWRSIE
jgi:hypothetical protein